LELMKLHFLRIPHDAIKALELGSGVFLK
jgi:hypothetical protein